MRKTTWYAAKGFFLRTDLPAPEGRRMYEERGHLLRATDFDEALWMADADARQYAASVEGAEYLGFVDVGELESDRLAREMRAYSFLRATDLEPEPFFRRYQPRVL